MLFMHSLNMSDQSHTIVILNVQQDARSSSPHTVHWMFSASVPKANDSITYFIFKVVKKKYGGPVSPKWHQTPIRLTCFSWAKCYWTKLATITLIIQRIIKAMVCASIVDNFPLLSANLINSDSSVIIMTSSYASSNTIELKRTLQIWKD